MQLSVIILNYNVRYFLEQCVLSVQKALEGIEGEIIVVDNASHDDSSQMIKDRFPQVKYIQNKKNYGFPKGNNIGVDIAQGKYICILNPDTVVAEDTFSKILNFINSKGNDKQKSNIGIIGCKLIDGRGNFLPESKRSVPTPWVAFTKIFGLYKFFPKWKVFNRYYAQHISENQSGEVDILVGAFMVMKRKIYRKIGGFDEKCFMYSDDIDLSFLAKKMGYHNFYFHETSIIHYKGESTVRDEKYVKRFNEAMQFFYKKHFSPSLFFATSMKIGSFFFSIFKKNQQKNSVLKIDATILFSKKKSFIENLKFDTILYDLNSFNNSKNINTQIIFDTRFYSFKDIIAFMEKHKANNLTFKNYIPQSEFLIGSNNANDMGEVINLTKNN